MDPILFERIAIVETKVDALRQGQFAVQEQLQTVCDYVLAEKARKSLARNALAVIGGFIAAAGTLWEVYPKK